MGKHRVDRPYSEALKTGEPFKLAAKENFARLKNTRLQRLYNYNPELRRMITDIRRTQKIFINMYKDEEDLPESFRKFIEEDLTMIINYLRQWKTNKLRDCECETWQLCDKCFAGKRGDEFNEFYSKLN